MKFLILTLFLFSSAHANTLNLKLVRKYNRDFYYKHQYQPFPKRIIFHSGNFSLDYIASRHGNCNLSQQKIEDGFNQKPNLVIIEGLQYKWGLNPSEWNSKLVNGIPIQGCDVYFAYKRAKELKISFMGAESGKLEDVSSYDRDIEFLKKLNSLREKYKKILVVYGAGHFIQQELVLESMFGKPKFIK